MDSGVNAGEIIKQLGHLSRELRLHVAQAAEKLSDRAPISRKLMQ